MGKTIHRSSNKRINAVKKNGGGKIMRGGGGIVNGGDGGSGTSNGVNMVNMINVIIYILFGAIIGFIAYSLYIMSRNNVKIVIGQNESDAGTNDVIAEMEEENKGSDYWGYGITSGQGTREMKRVDMRPIYNANVAVGVPINTPTRGQPSPMQQVGYLYKTGVDGESDIKTTKPQIMPILGGQTYSGSNHWIYYVMDNSTGIRMPLTIGGKKCSPNNHGCKELYDGDMITLPEYNATFQYKAYDNNTPQYIPYI